MHMTTEIYYKSDEVKALYETNGGIQTKESAGFDLVVPEDTFLKLNEVNLIDHQIVVRPAEGTHSEIFPRSSTKKKYGLQLSNSIGLIDRDYSGIDDTIKSAFDVNLEIASKNLKSITMNQLEALKEKEVCLVQPYNSEMMMFIPKGTRLSQLVFRQTIVPKFIEFDPTQNSRGGFGSTGE